MSLGQLENPRSYLFEATLQKTIKCLDREGFLGSCSQPTTTECPRQTGPQARVSGKDSVPPAKRRWVPPSTLRHHEIPTPETRNDLVFRKVRGILNKLTPDKFKKLSDDLLRTELTSDKILKGVIFLIFEKALDEPKYSSMYAQLCKRLSEEAPNFEPPGSPCTFRRLLLNKCKVEFEHRSEILEQHGSHDPSLEDEERRHLAKRKMLGNIKFIGELGKLEILSENILHRCIQELLCTKKSDSEDLECLCQIIRTCGRILDTDKGKKLMDQYFMRMSQLADNQELQPRIRFMLKDIIDLRSDGWAPRKVAVVEGPVPIHQIRPNEDDRPGFRRDRMPDRDRDTDRSNMNSDMFRSSMKRDPFLNYSSSANLIPNNHYNNSAGFGGQRDGGFRGHNNSRTGFNNYSNRGQFKHNQSNSNSNYNNQSNKETAPRFKKNLITAEEGEIELRPAANSLSNKVTVKTNNLMNRQLDPPLSTPKQTSTPLLKELPLKQVPPEKPKQAKKEKGPTKEEVQKKFSTLIEEYLKGDCTLNQAVDSYKEHKVPDKFAKDIMQSGLKTFVLDKTKEDQQKFIVLLASLKKDSLLSSAIIHDKFKNLCNLIEECENEKTKVTDAISVLLASAVKESLLSLSDVASFTEHGAYYPLFICTLQELKEIIEGDKELSKLFSDSKVTLLAQLPENDRTKERLTEILDEKRLTFLCPMLQLEADLAKQLQTDPNPQQFYKWIKENLESIDFNEPGFITALMTVLLKYITQEAATLAAGEDKAIAEKERMLLEKYQLILHSFLNEKPSLQLVAVYALQVHFYALGFPRGQLLRWFNALYDLSIVEEEAFLTWKEDVTDVYPGKGKALFQVNQWLTWLQEAESEEEEGDE